MSNNIRFIFGSKLWGKFRKGNNDSPEDLQDTTLEQYEDTKSDNKYYLAANPDVHLPVVGEDPDRNTNFSFGGDVGHSDGLDRVSVQDLDKTLDIESHLGGNLHSVTSLIQGTPVNVPGENNCKQEGPYIFCYPDDWPPPRTFPDCPWCQAWDGTSCVPHSQLNPCEKCVKKTENFTVTIIRDDGSRTTKQMGATVGQDISPSLQCKSYLKNCEDCAVDQNGNCAPIARPKPELCAECKDGEWETCKDRDPASSCVNGECKPTGDCPQPCIRCDECVFIDPNHPRRGKTCKSKCTPSLPDCVPIAAPGGGGPHHTCVCLAYVRGCPPDKPNQRSDKCECYCAGEESIGFGKTAKEICLEQNGNKWENCSCISACDPPCTDPCEACTQVDGVWACRPIGDTPVANASNTSNNTCDYTISEFPFNLLP